MKKKHLRNYKFYSVILFLCLISAGKSFAQITGSLFMLPDNFYAQMYNPAYFRTDEAIEISVAGLGGFSFLNQGSFKISDLIKTPGGSPVLDLNNFYNNIGTNNFFRQDVAVPVLFTSVPTKKGVFSFYWKENVNSVLKFKKDVIEFLINGNVEPGYRNFNTDAISVLTTGYREFALGYAKKKNKKLDFGIRAKLLFAGAFLNADKWNYNLETADDGTFINFTSGGLGNMMLPVPIRLREDSTIFSIQTENAFSKYMRAYENKGFALDFGINYHINESSNFSAAIRDLGAIWYNYKALALTEYNQYGYIGFDWINAIRFPEEPGYVHPLYLIDLVKDSLRNVWHPKVTDSKFSFALATKLMLNYQFEYSEKLSFGVTEQAAFQKNNFQNILSFSALQKWFALSVFESLNIHGVSDISLGAGIQYEGKFAQLFLATDNIIAFYHPANNKTFSVTAGICILLNHKKEVDPDKEAKKGIKKRNGKIDPHLPYYKHLNDLKR